MRFCKVWRGEVVYLVFPFITGDWVFLGICTGYSFLGA